MVGKSGIFFNSLSLISAFPNLYILTFADFRALDFGLCISGFSIDLQIQTLSQSGLTDQTDNVIKPNEYIAQEYFCQAPT